MNIFNNKNNKKLGGFIIFLVFSFICCTKPQELVFQPSFQYVVVGTITNDSCRVRIFTIDENQNFTQETKAKVHLMINSSEREFNHQNDAFYLKDFHIPPATDYTLHVLVDDKELEYTGQLPDTVEKAELRLENIKDFQYEFKLDLESKSVSDEFGYYRDNGGFGGSVSNLKPPLMGYEKEYLDFTRNESFPVAKTNPLVYNKDYQITIYRVFSKFIEGNKVILEFFENSSNPLYLAYNLESDVLKDDAVFRIIELLKIETNTVRVEDTTPTVVELQLINLAGQEVSVSELTDVTSFASFEDIRPRAAHMTLELQDPLEFSLSQFAQLLTIDQNGEIDLNDLLNRPIRLYLQGIDRQGRRIGCNTLVRLSSLSESVKVQGILPL